jgi:hypothetical protein
MATPRRARSAAELSKVGRQRLALSLPARRYLYRRLCFGHRRFGFQVFELEFQLLDLLVQLLGAAAKLHASQLGQHQLEVLDFGGGGG